MNGAVKGRGGWRRDYPSSLSKPDQIMAPVALWVTELSPSQETADRETFRSHDPRRTLAAVILVRDWRQRSHSTSEPPSHAAQFQIGSSLRSTLMRETRSLPS